MRDDQVQYDKAKKSSRKEAPNSKREPVKEHHPGWRRGKIIAEWGGPLKTGMGKN